MIHNNLLVNHSTVVENTVNAATGITVLLAGTYHEAIMREREKLRFKNNLRPGAGSMRRNYKQQLLSSKRCI